jgi:uncharacterized membrane-anchored protein YhcB (DUF1043 family)
VNLLLALIVLVFLGILIATFVDYKKTKKKYKQFMDENKD